MDMLMMRRGVGTAFCILVLLAGCDHKAGGSTEPGSAGRKNPGPGEIQGGGPQKGKEYPWGLPGGDNGFEASVGPIYQEIINGNCSKAESKLAETIELGDHAPSPINANEAKILRVGIAMCRGDRATALRYFKEYRFPGYPDSGWYSCEIYAIAGSVLLHRPPSSFAQCPEVQPGGDQQTDSSTPDPDEPDQTTSEPTDPTVPDSGQPDDPGSDGGSTP
jgi:hypothetical protein